MEMWDIDNGGTIGPYVRCCCTLQLQLIWDLFQEYITLMAVWHNENALMMVEVNARGTQDLKRRGVQGLVDQVEVLISKLIPGCACGSLNCLIYSGYLSVACCLCTACTSPCCYYFFCAKPAGKNRAKHFRANSRQIQAAFNQDLVNKVLKSVRQILLDGPSDKLKLKTEELQAPGAAHDTLWFANSDYEKSTLLPLHS